jgi:hypothetical protein
MLQTARLSLEPLSIDHAREMALVLDDARLFAFTGGSPCTLDELRDRYRRQVTGWSHDRRERWLNWIVRERDTGRAEALRGDSSRARGLDDRRSPPRTQARRRDPRERRDALERVATLHITASSPSS